MSLSKPVSTKGNTWKCHYDTSRKFFCNSKITPTPVAMIGEKEKVMELQLAVAVTCHCSITAVDHLGEIIVHHGKGSNLERLKLHRTKCSNLIKNVISPALNKDLGADMVGQKFCIILDESTDVSSDKHLCIVVRYYSKSQKKIVTEFEIGTSGKNNRSTFV